MENNQSKPVKNDEVKPTEPQPEENYEPPQDYDPLADSANGELPASPLSSSGNSETTKRQRMNTPSPKPVEPQPGTSPQFSPFLVPRKLIAFFYVDILGF